VRFFLPIILLAAACTSTGAVAAPGSPSTSNERIQITVSLYVVDETGAQAPSPLSSSRSVADLNEVAARMQTIWDQAGIDLVVGTVARIEAPGEALRSLAEGDTAPFLDAAYTGAVAVPGASMINGFYVTKIGPANGLTPIGTRLFFVADHPSVDDERVSSHEVGHILGLHHTLEDPGRLMFSGTNGTDVTREEIDVARYGAQGILDGVR